MTTETEYRALLEQALEALEYVTEDYDDSAVGLEIEAILALRAELAKPVESSHTATQLAAMVLSDCGISTDYAALHMLVAARIARHEVEIMDSLPKLAKPVEPEFADNSVDYWQQRGYLGSPDEWREACRLFRVRCSPEDVQRMGKLRAYVEDGLLIVSRPDSNTSTPAWHDAPTEPGLWACLYEGEISTAIFNAYEIENFDVEQMEDCRWYGPIPQDSNEGGEA